MYPFRMALYNSQFIIRKYLIPLNKFYSDFMIQLESLEINNFRGFDHLKMNEFSKINVLVGKNNIGKTSVLESIFLLSGMSNPELALNLNLMRGLPVNKNVLKYIFYNLETKNAPSIIGEFSEGTTRVLEISPFFEKKKVETSSRGLFSDSSLTPVTDISGLRYDFSVTKPNKPKESFETLLRFEKDEIIIDPDYTYKEDIFSRFLTSDVTDDGLLERLNALFVSKKEHVMNELLNKFDAKINDMYVLPNGIYVDREGVSERIPLQMTGDGIRRFLNVAATIAANDKQNFICLIDEIEKGLHHESQELMWRTLFMLTRPANIQLFITTHSWEMLESLAKVLKQDEYLDMWDDVKLISVVNTLLKGFQSYTASFEGLDTALEYGLEIR